jgi:hypothetical protein
VAGAAIGFYLRAQSTSQAAGRAAEFVVPPPKVITGATRPLLAGNTARPLRYRPVDGDFVIRNGGEFFNRPLYGPNINFRADAGDLPEFSLYLPGHGGNLKLGLSAASGSKWLAQAAEVIARYRPGRMIYEVRDPLLAQGWLRIEVLTAGQGAGLMLQAEAHDVSPSTALTWAFGGVSGRKGARNGDIGCEVEPVSRFFQVRPEECAGNQYTIEAAPTTSSLLQSPTCSLLLTFPAGSHLSVADVGTWDVPIIATEQAATSAAPQLPILTGWVPLGDGTPMHFLIQRLHTPNDRPVAIDRATAFAARGKQVSEIAATLRMSTPDPYISASAAAIGIAADGLWDAEQQCVMHGCVAWRGALAGWRGPYSLAALGQHDRMRQQVRHWITRQNTSPVSDSRSPVMGPPDAASHLARKEGLLHSNGDLSGNHYDMNMVFFDVFLRYLRWTGDIQLAREIWPAFQRHLAWEKRLFRRTYGGRGGKDPGLGGAVPLDRAGSPDPASPLQLPLYEAYAVIWASDNLQYNGGGATHSSAYNLFAFRSAAVLARLLGEDPEPYQSEASLIAEGIERHLWLPAQGAYAESKDWLGAQAVYTNPAVWTVYHTIDSEVPTPRQAWQMVAERLSVLRRVPVHGAGVPAGGWYMLSCSDWLPYLWSLNLLALAENVHLALAMWQAGMAEEAYLLLKGNFLDSLFMGLAPGNFHMTSELDAHRQEAQRDFGDAIGIATRALVEGLFGLQPDLLRGALTIRPGFPRDWNQASLQHSNLDFNWRREGSLDTYEISSRLPQPVPLTLILRARAIRLPKVESGGAGVSSSFDPGAVGAPALIVKLPAAPSWKVTVEWNGDEPILLPAHRIYSAGQALTLPPGVSLDQIDDPQHCLAGGHVAATGYHTVFANMHEGDCRWSLPISFEVKADAPLPAAAPAIGTQQRSEPVDLFGVLKHQINEIFMRPYQQPRSPFCSLALPEQLLGGWANLDMTAKIDDSGLRRAGGMLKTPLGVPFRTPTGTAPNCLFLSQWRQDQSEAEIPLTGRAESVYLLMTGVTFPQASRMEHGRITIAYRDGAKAQLSLKSPETWWPIEQDYFLDDYLFIDEAPLPPRVDLRTGVTRLLDLASFKGNGRAVPGGAATILFLPLDPRKNLVSLKVEANLYGIVVALLAATLVRPF